MKSIFTKALTALLVALMLVPSLASCSDTEDIEDTVIPVYTFYGIKGEGTTDDAIRAVELAINRILISRYTMAVDFRLFLEDEYEAALNAAIEEVKNYDGSNAEGQSSLASGEEDPYTYTEDKIIEMLESGKDFELKEPRVDIVLCKDSAQYFDLANSKKLVSLDITLENEGKILSEYIHPTLFALAKIGRKTFGVPNNVALGQYEYIVFDKEYLDEHKYDYKTMKTLEDLEDYLALIKSSNENVVPLKKAGSPATYQYMFGDNSPFYLNPTTTTSGENTGRIYGTLDTELFAFVVEDYATLIGKYRSLGYLSDGTDSDKDFAVTFLNGTPSDIEALEKETGKEYEYIVYKNPVATTESLGSLYSISSTVSDTEVTTLIDIIVAMFTDAQIKNYFYHGIQGEHYILDDHEMIEPIKNGSTGKYEYNMKNEYTGNVYLANLKQGESAKIYEDIKAINLATTLSLTSGFSYVPKTYEAGGKTLVEPNYVEIMKEAMGDGVLKLSDGSFGIVNYDEFQKTVQEELKTFAEDKVKTSYSDALIAAHVAKSSAYLNSEEFLSEVEKEATDIVTASLKATAQSALSIEYTKALKEQKPDATDDEINAEVAALLTEEALSEYISKNFTEADITSLIETRKKLLITEATNKITSSYKDSSEYKKAVSSYVSSSEYTSAVNQYIKDQGDDYVEKKFLTAIEDQILAECSTLQGKAVEAVEKAIKDFNDKVKSELGLSDDDLDVFSYTDFVEKRVKAQYFSVYADPDATT